MKKIKKCFYLSSAFLSGASLVVMTLLILAQIAARLAGVVIPSSEDFAGWLLSSTIFFGLAYTFNEGGHIRVTMLLTRLSEKKRRFQEFFNIFVGLFISGYMAFYSIYTVYESYIFDEVSETYVVIPMWTIQSPMAIGTLFLFIAILDNCIEMIKGNTPKFIANEDELSGEE